jgi:hypothetical protein
MRNQNILPFAVLQVLLLLAALLAWQYIRVREIQTSLSSYVQINDHNNLVKAEKQLVIAVSNLTQQAEVQGAAVRLIQEQSASLTNLYLKMNEFEQTLGEIGQLSKTNTWQGPVSQLAAQVETLKKGVLNMSLGMQQLQALRAKNVATAVTSTPAKTTP